MIAAPGSTLWLLRHEVRLTLRGMGRGRKSRIGVWFSLLMPLLLALACGLPLGLVLRRVDLPVERAVFLAADAVLLVVFTLSLSQTLSAAVDALYQRADLDLLFSSPLPPRRVLFVRFLGVAVSVTFVFAYFIAPILIPIALLGHPTWLAALLVLFAVGLASAGVGLLLAGAMFRLIGPRRTRTVGQVAAALIGAAFFLVFQTRNILGEAKSESLFAAVTALARDPDFHPPPGADWPLRAMLGEPVPLLALSAAGAGVFLLATSWLGRRFAADAAAAAGASGATRVRAVKSRAFTTSVFGATLRKEWRLLFRDPALLTQVLVRVLYLLPLGFVMLRNAGQGRDYLLPGAAGGMVILAAQVAGSLAWITVSAEDAPDLLASAPTPMPLLWRAKMAAAAVPVGVLLLVVLAPLAALNPWVAAIAAIGCAAGVSSALLMNMWWQRPGKRAEFRRQRRANIFVALAEFFISVLIAAATGLTAAGLWWGLVPAAAAGVVLLLLRRTPEQVARAVRAP